MYSFLLAPVYICTIRNRRVMTRLSCPWGDLFRSSGFYSRTALQCYQLSQATVESKRKSLIILVLLVVTIFPITLVVLKIVHFNEVLGDRVCFFEKRGLHIYIKDTLNQHPNLFKLQSRLETRNQR